MKWLAVIDTNVLVSALLSSHEDATTVQVLARLFSGDFIPLFSDQILKEYNDVLRRKKFGFSEGTVAALVGAIEKCGERVVPTPTGEILPDNKDFPFYEVVMEKQDDDAYLVTGNMKHFPKRPFIVSAREFLNLLEAN